jgi:hypothetical protein
MKTSDKKQLRQIFEKSLHKLNNMSLDENTKKKPERANTARSGFTYTDLFTTERNKLVIVPTFNVKPKTNFKLTKTRKAFVWSEDGEDYTIIDKNGNVFEGIDCFTIEQMAEMFIQCALEKIDKLTALKTEKGREIADEISNVIVELISGEIGKIDSYSYKGIDFRREKNFLHQMLILICRYGDEWKGITKELKQN